MTCAAYVSGAAAACACMIKRSTHRIYYHFVLTHPQIIVGALVYDILNRILAVPNSTWKFATLSYYVIEYSVLACFFKAGNQQLEWCLVYHYILTL